MRGILVDHARSRDAAKGGGGAVRVPLDEALAISEENVSNLIAIDQAFKELAKFAPRKNRVVELRFFGGLTVEETAEVLGTDCGSREFKGVRGRFRLSTATCCRGRYRAGCGRRRGERHELTLLTRFNEPSR